MYTRSYYDACVYYKKLPGGEYIYLLLYVDDMLAFKSRFTIDKLKKDLFFKFEIKDLSEMKKMLSMEIERHRKGDNVSLTQKGYLKKIFQKFNINDTKSVSTPLAPHFKLKVTMSPTVEEREYMTHVLYTSVVGSLMYAMVCIRPDL